MCVHDISTAFCHVMHRAHHRTIYGDGRTHKILAGDSMVMAGDGRLMVLYRNTD
jgi:hypothetical protein